MGELRTFKEDKERGKGKGERGKGGHDVPYGEWAGGAYVYTLPRACQVERLPTSRRTLRRWPRIEGSTICNGRLQE